MILKNMFFPAAIAMIAGMSLNSCTNENEKKEPSEKIDSVEILFKNKISAKGFSLDSVGKDGSYYVNTGTQHVKVNLGNARSAFLLNGDTMVLHNLISSFASDPGIGNIENWNWAKGHVYLYLAPNGNDFSGVPKSKVSNFLQSIWVVYDGTKFLWVDSTLIQKWNVTDKEIASIADENMYAVLRRSTMKKDKLEGIEVHYLETELPFASSFLFIDRFKWRVDKNISWPCFAVIPTRNFACIISGANFDPFMEKLGSRVKREFMTGAYPLTTEVFKFSDKGPEVIGMFK